MSPDDDNSLRNLYRHFRVPVEQFFQRPLDLEEFVDLWQAATGRNDTADEVVHYMMTKRKQGKWETFDGKHKRLRCPENSIFTKEEWIYIVAWLQNGRVTADQLATDQSLAGDLNQLLIQEFGHAVSTNIMVAAIIAKRKRGELPKLGSDHDDDIGFSDIDEVA